MDQAEDSGIDLYSMEEGEAITFMAREASTRSTKKVTVTRGACYQYSDYGYGSYLTYKYTVKFGNVSATAYCIQPEKSSPGTGTYDITKLSDDGEKSWLRFVIMERRRQVMKDSLQKRTVMEI